MDSTDHQFVAIVYAGKTSDVTRSFAGCDGNQREQPARDISGMDASMRRRKRRSRYRSASDEGKSTSKEVRFHQEQPEDAVKVGCVMLSKVRYRMKDPTARVPARCSLGYALRTDEEVCRCMAAAGPNDCWKSEPSWRVSPEQFEPNGTGRVIAEKLAPEHL